MDDMVQYNNNIFFIEYLKTQFGRHNTICALEASVTKLFSFSKKSLEKKHVKVWGWKVLFIFLGAKMGFKMF